MFEFFDIKKYKYLIVSVLGVLILILVLSISNLSKEEVDVVLENEVVEEVEKEEIVEIIDKIKIDIKGAVLNPGVYELEQNSRVSDAISISGGLIDTADTSTINLSKLLKDEMVIIIYTKDEIKEMRKGNTVVKYIEKECVCPKLENDACIEDKVTNNETKENVSGKVSLNNATIDELMTLSGIGESKAKLIIEYREQNGGFKSIDEITNVKGIGQSTYEKIKDNLTL